MTETAAPESVAWTILIVDDTPANLGVVVESLEDRGFRVLVAEDGEEGLQRAAFVRPDLILLDVMMPGLSGFETCQRLKALDSTRDIPVVFMTSLTDTEDKVSGFGAGGVDYLRLHTWFLVGRAGSSPESGAAPAPVAPGRDEQAA